MEVASPGSKKYDFSKKLLCQKYIIEKKSIREIAKEFNVSGCTIRTRSLELKNEQQIVEKINNFLGNENVK